MNSQNWNNYIYNEIDNAVTKQKQQNEIIDLTDDVFDENNLFNDENRWHLHWR